MSDGDVCYVYQVKGKPSCLKDKMIIVGENNMDTIHRSTKIKAALMSDLSQIEMLKNHTNTLKVNIRNVDEMFTMTL